MLSKKIKIFIISLALVFVTSKVFSQQNVTVDITDDVYSFLTIAETKGYCERLPLAKPYSQNYIIKVLTQIKDFLTDNSDKKFAEEG